MEHHALIGINRIRVIGEPATDRVVRIRRADRAVESPYPIVVCHDLLKTRDINFRIEPGWGLSRNLDAIQTGGMRIVSKEQRRPRAV
jgi:hypothetical protein